MACTTAVILYCGLIGLTAVLLALISILRKLSREIIKNNDEHKKRVAEYGALWNSEFDKMKAMSNLCLHLIPLKIQMDIQGIDMKDRHARLDMKKWSAQFWYGVTRACGFEIDWIDDDDDDDD